MFREVKKMHNEQKNYHCTLKTEAVENFRKKNTTVPYSGHFPKFSVKKASLYLIGRPFPDLIGGPFPVPYNRTQLYLQLSILIFMSDNISGQNGFPK